MLTDFFTRALLGGLGVAALAGPLGCFVVWRRMAYFGDTLAHAGLLGAALAILIQANLTIAVFVVGMCLAFSLVLLERRSSLSVDALLGILSHTALSLGLVVLSLMTWVRFDITALLFGDLLSVSREDLGIIALTGIGVVAILWRHWDSMLISTVSPELAEAEGYNPKRAQWVLVFLLAAVLAIAVQIIGVLLITALLIIPAAAARQLSRTPESMAFTASSLGMLSVVAGLYSSLWFDTPAGPSVVLAAATLFGLTYLPFIKNRR